MTLLRYLRGLWRLRFGFCPECNSSPPRPSCFVCEGSTVYGHVLDQQRRSLWRYRWDGRRAGSGPIREGRDG